MSYNVLLLGAGGREHTLAWGIHRSSQLGRLFAAPGNAGIAEICETVDLSLDDFDAITTFAKENDIHLVVVGPEKPLVDGITDHLKKHNISVFGPTKTAAQLEGSKAFAKQFMKEQGIPTAGYSVFTQDEFDEASDYIRNNGVYPVVLKASGLAGGKGVFICQNQSEVDDRLKILRADFKDASSTLVVEEFMEGEEASVFVICDGQTAKIIGTAQDHKRIGDGDTGLNTGGMGAYAPSPLLDESLMESIEREIIMPTITGMIDQQTPYTGVLYLGLMITQEGPKVVEYNCRFGDPECQVIVPKLKTDLLQLLLDAANGKLHSCDIETDNQFHCCVIQASEGYPLSYVKGFPITISTDVKEDTLIFHSGTELNNGQLVTDGGRVIGIVQHDSTLAGAIEKTYKEVAKVSFDNACYRTDIGKKGLKHVTK